MSESSAAWACRRCGAEFAADGRCSRWKEGCQGGRGEVIPEASAAEKLADVIVGQVAELPDRSSPEDWPEAMLITGDELRRIVVEHFSALTTRLAEAQVRIKSLERAQQIRVDALRAAESGKRQAERERDEALELARRERLVSTEAIAREAKAIGHRMESHSRAEAAETRLAEVERAKEQFLDRALAAEAKSRYLTERVAELERERDEAVKAAQIVYETRTAETRSAEQLLSEMAKAVGCARKELIFAGFSVDGGSGIVRRLNNILAKYDARQRKDE